MTLIDGDRIVTAQLYDDEHEDFTEQKMSIIDYVNMYTTEGVTTADDVLDKIRAEFEELRHYYPMGHDYQIAITRCLAVIDKYRAESEEL